MLGHTGHIAGTREVIPHESYRPVYEARAILTVDSFVSAQRT